MQLATKTWRFVILLSVTISGCNGPTEVNPSDQFEIPTSEMRDVESKIQKLDCEAFDRLMDHYEYAANDIAWINRKKWLDFAMNKPMRDCTAQSANSYADILLDNSKETENNKLSDKYAMLMEAWRYAEHGYDHAKPGDSESAQRTINEINLELWKLRKGEFKNAVVK
jgi:hypothetical protein